MGVVDKNAFGAVGGLNGDYYGRTGRRRLARVLTFGCKMNENDSEAIMGLLDGMGYEIELPRASGKFGNPAPLGALGYLNADNLPDGARLPNLVILNTCCIRENAESRLFGILGSLKKLKSADSSCIVAVCGCMMQEDKAVAGIQDKYSYVNFVFGTKAIPELPALLYDEYMKQAAAAAIRDGKPGQKKLRAAVPVRNDLAGSRFWLGDGLAAMAEAVGAVGCGPDTTCDAGTAEAIKYVPAPALPMYRKAPPLALVSIMSGCDNYCSYCVVPYVRGREESRAPESIIDEVRQLASDGYREITLLGQNVNSYGNDFNKKSRDTSAALAGGARVAINAGAVLSSGAFAETRGRDFAWLLGQLAAIEGIWRIRFMTSHPKDLSDRLIGVMRDNPSICKQLHLPVQSGSTEVLRRMNRGYSREDYIGLVRRIRDAMPDIVLTTDFIVGFPGESEADFDDTLKLVDEIGFDLAYTFLFSPREGTAAAKFADRIADDVAKARFNRLLALQNRISLKKNRACVGKFFEVLCEGRSKTNAERYTGRTPGGKVVNFICENVEGADLTGRLITVRAERARTWSLDGEAVM